VFDSGDVRSVSLDISTKGIKDVLLFIQPVACPVLAPERWVRGVCGSKKVFLVVAAF
jgi:hypothetical protein